MINKRHLPLISAGFGTLLFLFTFFVVRKWSDRTEQGSPLARLEDAAGEVSILKRSLTERKPVDKSNNSIFSLESLETGNDSQVLLVFPTAYRIRILPQSLVTLESQLKSTLIILKRGNIQVENFGQEGSVYISYEGRKVMATDYELEKQATLKNGMKSPVAQPPQTTTSNPLPEEVQKMNTNTLSQEDIQNTLNKYKSLFNKCYTQLLQVTPGLTGQATLSFDIEKSGKISKPEITNTNLNDPKFKSCLIEVLNRVEFNAFSGDPISTVFPLKFE